MDDEKFGHRILDTALLNYLSQLQVFYKISSQIDKTLTTLRLLQIVKNSARIGFRFFFKFMKNFWRILLPSAHLTKIRPENFKISNKMLPLPSILFYSELFFDTFQVFWSEYCQRSKRQQIYNRNSDLKSI